jgi:uncharacterized protein YjdB
MKNYTTKTALCCLQRACLIFSGSMLTNICAGQLPAISSVSPGAGNPGSSVTISGTNFNTTPANNIVFFGATKSTVTASSATSLTADIPVGATHKEISVTNTASALSGYSQYSFLPTFNNNAYVADTINFKDKIDLITGTTSAGMAVGDIDGDGKADLIAANNASNTISVFRNTESGGNVSFATKVDFATDSFPTRVSVGDLDGDGKPEVVVTNLLSHTVSVFLNTSTTGSITFDTKIDYVTETSPWGVTIADMDLDGKPEICVANSNSANVSVYRNTSSIGSISFDARVNFGTALLPIGIVSADADGDGLSDLIVGNGSSASVSVLRNTSSFGSISFDAKADFSVGILPYDVTAGDVDGDGNPDIVTANNSGNSISVLRNTGSTGSISFATKVDYSTTSGAAGITMGDIDGDGKVDIAVTNPYASSVSVFRNSSSSGTIALDTKVDFTTAASPWGIVIGDLDNDSKPDIATSTQSSNSVTILINSPLPLLPTIISVSPDNANPGASITITGTNFNSTPVNNIVFFGATRATVTSASATSLTTTLPAGASYDMVSVNNLASNLTAYSQYRFLPTYDNSPYIAGMTNFSNKVDFDAGTLTTFDVSVDIDGDGMPDIAVVNSTSNTFSVLRNTSSPGALSFDAHVDFATASNPACIAAGDLDGDGKPDVVIANGNSDKISVYLNTSTPGSVSFTAKTDYLVPNKPLSVIIGDIDGDGKADIATANRNAGSISVLRNTCDPGSISFDARIDYAVGSDPYEVTMGDLDGDSKNDLVVANSGSNSISFFRNTSSAGTISFEAKFDTSGLNAPYSVEIGDLDDDGKPEVVVTNYSGATASVFRNIGSPGTVSFAAKTEFVINGGGFNIALGDIDGDGKADMAASNIGGSRVVVLLNTSSAGSLSFANKMQFSTLGAPRSVAINDLDGDGKPDLAIGSQVASSVSVLRNNPLSYIAGNTAICAGSTTTLVDSATGGTWTSSNTSVATVGTSDGIVTGITGGTARITYTVPGGTTTIVVTVNSLPDTSFTGTPNPTLPGLPVSITPNNGSYTSYSWNFGDGATSTSINPSHAFTAAGTYTISLTPTTVNGCSLTATTVVTVNATAGSISGTPVFCVGDDPDTLTHPISGGAWSSSAPTTASVDASSGIVTGISPGYAVISYNIGAGYTETVNAVVGSLPPDITGYNGTCVGTTTGLIGIIGGSGTWSSSNTSIATVGTGSGVVTGIAPGTTTMTYTMPWGCYKTRVQTINETPASISGASSLCKDAATTLTCSTSGGTWLSSNSGVVTIDTATGVAAAVTSGTATISYILSTGCGGGFPMTVVNPPAAISGSTLLCRGNTTTLSSATSGQTWSSNNTSVASVSSAGLVTGTGDGTATISYTNAAGCYSIITVTVQPALPANTGANIICVGKTTTLANATSGGTWQSSNTSKATVGYYSGLVAGIASGTSNITYTVSSGCTSITQLTVDASPAAITGSSTVCKGSATTLSHVLSGGTWTSSNTAVASVDATSGSVTGVNNGYAYITYTLSSGCNATKFVIVNPAPHAIYGATFVAIGSYTLLTDPTSGGTWSSSNTAVASMPFTSLGYVLGVSTGSATITYTVPSTGCYAAHTISVYSTSSRPENTDIQAPSSIFSVFPNPTSASLNVTSETDGEFTIYTLDGKMMRRYQLATGTTAISLPNEIAQGIYMGRFNGRDGSAGWVRLVVEK